ncbi:ParB-like partition protein [Eggerthia catenaformis OT 569 = DSM 20559]|uniref:ParB-like partition protein n=1 Tax=Eggerthia catenaformis OT 569 = DSM 20559 TaxID=999415 RepID=M2Q0T5_9FIRM|nr:ParB/RepB/Spo0J family partition protein [Eggerthia catenaformis]EMD15906.1 ParB-like partition protein [Eggerthia catenaformis OT 569 = DSM 20559]
MPNKKKKSGLGKGLNAIFNDGNSASDLVSMIDAIEKNAPELTQTKILLKDIRTNPYQPRKYFDEEKLNELAQSIKEHGVFQPILLKKSIHGYDIVAGERRWRAAKIAGLEDIPSIIVDFTDDQMMEIALLENIQREDLNAIEEAQGYQAMMDKLHLTQEELAQRVGKSRTHVTNTLRLLNISKTLQKYILDGILSMGHIRPLIGLPEDKALQTAKKAVDEKLSVRQVEDIVKGIKLSLSKKNKSKETQESPYNYAETLIRKKYGTKVKIQNKTITIKYTDIKDLNRILELMGVIEEI